MLPLLSIEDLSVGFRQEGKLSPALHQVSFAVNRGEIVAIVGESGSGKSVSSLSILRLLPVPPAVYTRGKILFSTDGNTATDLLQLPEKEMRYIRGNRISMIFQEPMTSLNPLYSCGNQVMEAIILHQHIGARAARQKTIELFEKVQLPDPVLMFGKYPHEISGGQMQRVMIAMAMSCEPVLLIADEPTTALDVTVQQNILQLIKALQAEKNMAVIFISHDLGLVAEIADRILVMYRGRIVEQNTTKELFTTPQHPYTRALLACRPILHRKDERLPLVSDFVNWNADGQISEAATHPAVSATAHIGTQVHQPTNPVKEKQPFVEHNEQGGAAGTALLRAEHLSVWFPQRTAGGVNRQVHVKAVDDVSFEIYAGEMVGLVGESGCGKTTLGRSLLRLIHPTAGSLYYKEQNLLRLSARELRRMRKHIQIIFQDPYSSLNPRIPVGAAILEAMQVHGVGSGTKERKEKVVQLLKKVNLEAEHYHRYPHEFSGGQRQRIGIARALALEPAFIVCDESVSALDVSVQAQVLNLLNDLKQEFGFAALFISHDLSVVRYISDRILVMHRGRIVEQGDAETIYNNPRNPYTQKLVDAVPVGILPS